MLPNSAEIESCKTKRTKFLANAGKSFAIQNVQYPVSLKGCNHGYSASVHNTTDNLGVFSVFAFSDYFKSLVSLIFGYNGYHFPFVCHIKGVKPRILQNPLTSLLMGKTASCISMPQFEADDISLSTVARPPWLCPACNGFLYCFQSDFLLFGQGSAVAFYIVLNLHSLRHYSGVVVAQIA